MPECFNMLNIASGFVWIFKSDLSAECAVCPPSRVMPDDAIANAIWFWGRMHESISEIRNVLPVPHGGSEKKSTFLANFLKEM